MVAVLSRVFLRERITPRVAAGIACAVGGIALVSLAAASGTAAQRQRCSATLLLLGAVICEASYVVIGKQLTGQVSARAHQRADQPVGAGAGDAVRRCGRRWRFDFARGRRRRPGRCCCSIRIAASVVTVWLWMTGLQHVPASSAGVFTVLLPVSAAAVGVLFLGERFSAAQAAAFALALAGVVLATWPARVAAGRLPDADRLAHPRQAATATRRCSAPPPARGTSAGSSLLRAGGPTTPGASARAPGLRRSAGPSMWRDACDQGSPRRRHARSM